MKDIIGSFEKISMNVPPGALNPDVHRKKKGICESIIFSKRCEYTYLNILVVFSYLFWPD